MGCEGRDQNCGSTRGLSGLGWWNWRIRLNDGKQASCERNSNLRERDFDVNVDWTQHDVKVGVDWFRVIGDVNVVSVFEKTSYESITPGSDSRHGSCTIVYQHSITSTLKARTSRVRSMSRQRARGVLGGESTCGGFGGIYCCRDRPRIRIRRPISLIGRHTPAGGRERGSSSIRVFHFYAFVPTDYHPPLFGPQVRYAESV